MHVIASSIRDSLRPLAILAIVLAAAPLGLALAEDGDTGPIDLQLPEPYFGGTPLDYFGSNLEEPDYKPRPPFLAPAGTSNVAAGKAVSSSVSGPTFGKLDFLVDGDKSYKEESLLGLKDGVQWVQIDLGAPHALHAIALWHFHEGDRVYFDIVVQVADDAEFSENVRTVFNNDHDNSTGLGAGEHQEYIESYKSKLIDTGGVQARFVRFYSNGNTTDSFNHYVEAEIFGLLAGG